VSAPTAGDPPGVVGDPSGVVGDPSGVVDHPDEVSPAWLSAALRAGGLDVEITALRYEAIGTGQTGASYRFHPQSRPEDAGRVPASVVIKMGAGGPEARSRVKGGYRNEIGYYTTFAGVSRIRAPHCWSAAISQDGLRFTLVLEDAHPALPGRQVDGCSAEQATAAVHNLAGLHAPFWDDDGMTGHRHWLTQMTEDSLPFLRDVHVAAAGEFVKRFRAELSSADAAILLRTAEATVEWGRRTLHRNSLIHGDYRLDNLLFGADGSVLAVDWQTLAVGFPGRDLAYFLSTALQPADRRRHEAALVAAYHERLVEHGIRDYLVEECFVDYRLGLLQGPMITTIGCAYATGVRTDDSDRMFLSMAINCAAAIRDLDPLELVSAR
jgi:hypothetical protein